MDPLEAVSPIDGRYRKTAEPLAAFFSEGALIRYRVKVEAEYLIALSAAGLGLRRLTNKETAALRNLSADVDVALAKRFEMEGVGMVPATNHDVKAVEYLIKDRLKESSMKDMLEWVHFGLTSEDVNNIAHSLALADALEKAMVPALVEIGKKLTELAAAHAALSMLARTHGQPASPTTFGKEFKVFEARLERQVQQIASRPLPAKLNGATGNYNAHAAAYPNVDWMAFAHAFIEQLNAGRIIKLELNPFTTQIEPHDGWAELFDNLKRANTVLIDLAQDIWRYISDGWIVQAPKEGEVGSSTMPHKVNPIDFENAEGNLGTANALFEFFARKLPVSRLQRDLSDSTVERSFGTAFAHSLIAYQALVKGFNKIRVNEKKVREDLRAHPEVIAEAIQTILRREGMAMPYEELKKMTRGKQVTMEDFAKFIDGLAVSGAVKQELKAITPENYIGLAEKLAKL